MPQNIQDIRRDQAGISLLEDLRTSLRPHDGGEKSLPTLLLYDEQGLKLFEEITYLDEYYLTNAEIEVLENNAAAIADLVPGDCDILELGSGNLRKVKILLDALELARKKVNYFALDLSKPELERTLSAVPEQYQYVRCHGLLGTYDDALDWLGRPEQQRRPKWILSLGSSLGNFGRVEAAAFLRGFANTLGSNDCILIGLDACQDQGKILSAYNDRDGKTHEFVLNGLAHANRLLTKDVFRLEDWKVIGEYDESAGRHQAFYSPTKDLVVDGVYVETGEKIRVEESYKWSSKQSSKLWQTAGLEQRATFGNGIDDYHLHVLAKPTLAFPHRAAEYAAEPVPNLQEFKQLWAAWDVVTRYMIPEDGLQSKPIRLRNCCIFYLGHIPAFLDIHLTRATVLGATEPKYYQSIFERGIDPDVDNPENCHSHSEIPDSWPPVEEILDYQTRVRARVESLFNKGDEAVRGVVGRALWLAFEHEAMHLETFLYILLQSDMTLPPPGPIPDFEALGHKAGQTAVGNAWIRVPPTTISVGMDDTESNNGSASYFGWDNEKPVRKIHVPAFKAKARPLTNEDFARYLYATNQETLPASWTQQISSRLDSAKTASGSLRSNGHGEQVDEAFMAGKFVRTVYGPVALRHALAWPVFASYDELAGCAKFLNGRIPTADEVRSIYSQVDVAKKKEAEKVQAKKISAVNGHLSNNGVEESPPSAAAVNGSSSVNTCPVPSDLFIDLEGCNVGLSSFHPTPVTQLGNKLCGRGELGGVWEWTSTTLEEHEGFAAMEQYPGYTADFFDGKHNIVLGGSWATHPRIAGRKSFVNWFQRNYPYAWCGARLVRD
ncbi:hypothetical protein XANCAGTX0491_005204 [Xanthoria calcicola]